MKGKICLITGATDGIGLETAKALAVKGARVIIHGRNAQKGQLAVAEIIASSGNHNVEFIAADFASLTQVRQMAEKLIATLPVLDVLINNAGVAATSSLSYSDDGFERTFAVNHLAPFLLTHLLIGLLKKSTSARVVTVASIGHKFAPFDINDLMSKKTKPANAYFRSKFANILFSNELARRYKNDGITANCLHPGTVKSNFGKEDFKTALFYKLAGPFLKTVQQGAATVIYLASSSEVAGKTGGYYFKCRPAKPAAETADVQLAGLLWHKSEQLVGLVEH